MMWLEHILTLNLLNFLYGLVHLLFLELSIINFGEIMKEIVSWPSDSTEVHAGLALQQVALKPNHFWFQQEGKSDSGAMTYWWFKFCEKLKRDFYHASKQMLTHAHTCSTHDKYCRLSQKLVSFIKRSGRLKKICFELQRHNWQCNKFSIVTSQ